MWVFYTLACVPALIGLWLWHTGSGAIVWQEWLGGAALSFLLAGIMHLCAIKGMTDDVETWSGRVTRTIHYPRWVEKYRQAHTRTVGSGKNRRTEVYYTTEYRTHPEYWTADTDVGWEPEISHSDFDDFAQKFGGKIDTRDGHKSGFHSGDRNIYVCDNKTGYLHPVTVWRHWENRIKAAPSTFSFPSVPTNAPVFNYPKNDDGLARSDRLLGTARDTINRLEFDRMNTRLNPKKQVNVIIIGFGNRPASIAQLQQAKWLGGKKNDIVLCYGGSDPMKPSWAKVFSWTDKEVCERTLETILLTHTTDTTIIPVIESEIRANYKLRDWSEFDYIAIEPPTWSYVAFLLAMCVIQGGFWYWARVNQF